MIVRLPESPAAPDDRPCGTGVPPVFSSSAAPPVISSHAASPALPRGTGAPPVISPDVSASPAETLTSAQARPFPWLAYLLTALLVTALLALHAAYYYPFLSDDALISLRYADRLLAGKGLSWTDGRPVEGYSNLLWILLIAGLGLLRVDLIDASRLLGLAGMAAVVLAVLHGHFSHRHGSRSRFALAVGLGFFVLAAPVAVWTVGGLEQPLYAGLIAVSIPLLVRLIEADGLPSRSSRLRGSESLPLTPTLALSFVLGLITLTRPDGPLFSVATLASIYAGRLVARRPAFSPFRLIPALALFPLLAWGGQMAFRLAYYGDLVPNTARVKVAPSLHHLVNGIDYLQSGMLSLFPFSLLALAFMGLSIFSPRRCARGVPLLAVTILWMPYVAFVGGDIFPAHRHFLPLIVVFTFAIMEGTDWALSKLREPRHLRRRDLAFSLLSISAVVYGVLQFTLAENRKALDERWEWKGQVLGLFLRQAFGPAQPVVAVTAAGAVPYWSGLPSLDMVGLNDWYLPRNKPISFGRGYLGHELGNGQYVLDQRPDIICFHVGNKGAMFISGREMQQKPEFYELYVPVHVVAEGARNWPKPHAAWLWISKYSPKVGLRLAPSEIRVPGYLLQPRPETEAYLNASGRLVLPLAPGKSASLDLGPAPASDWSIHVSSTPLGGVRAALSHDRKGNLVLSVFSESAAPVEIEEVVLRRSLRADVAPDRPEPPAAPSTPRPGDVHLASASASAAP